LVTAAKLRHPTAATHIEGSKSRSLGIPEVPYGGTLSRR
jgi:hypothetical protein